MVEQRIRFENIGEEQNVLLVRINEYFIVQHLACACIDLGTLRLKCDGTRAETTFRLS